MPQPKTAAPTNGTETAPPPKMDVASAIKSVVSPATNVAATTASTKQDIAFTPAVEQLAPKSDASAETSNKALNGLIEIRLSPGRTEMKPGEKQLLAIDFKSDTPISMAVLTLRFDPRVIKVNAVLPGVIFVNAKTAPIIAQSIDRNGMLLVSITPTAGPIRATHEGSLLNIEVEAVGMGDSGLASGQANVHLMASDGRN